MHANKWMFLALTFLSTTVFASGTTSDLLEQRNAAAGFAGTLKFAIGRAASNCREALGKNDDYVHGIVDDWLSRNGKYSHAAEQWISLELSYVANHQGRQQAMQMRDQLMSIVNQSGNRTAASFVGQSDSDLKSRCPAFAANVHAGKYDITPRSPEYAPLLELMNFFAVQSLSPAS